MINHWKIISHWFCDHNNLFNNFKFTGWVNIHEIKVVVYYSLYLHPFSKFKIFSLKLPLITCFILNLSDVN